MIKKINLYLNLNLWMILKVKNFKKCYKKQILKNKNYKMK